MKNGRLVDRRVAPCWLLVCLLTTLWARDRVVVAQSLDAPGIRQALDRLIDEHPISRQTNVCLQVVDLESGETIYNRHGDWLMTPASNLKIYTTACALATFAPDHRFKTTVDLRGALQDGCLCGDIVLRGGGDPMLTNHDLSKLAARMVDEHRVHRVTGTVRVDNSRYRSPLKGPGWMWDDDPDYYNMSITPLMVDFNVLTVRVTPRVDHSSAVELVPSSDYPPIELVEDDSGEPRFVITRRPFEHAIRVTGAAQADKVTAARLTMHDPGRWVASVFRRMLVNRGVVFDDLPAESATRPPVNAVEVVQIEHAGVPLRDILKHFNEESENAIGEVLLHEIAMARGVRQPSWSDGARLISEWLVRDAGLAEGSFRLVDGSGLSRYNLISAGASTRLVACMRQHERGRDFLAALPTYDVDARQVDGHPTLPADAGIARVRAKSGYMSGVLTSSGIVRTWDERPLAFSYLTAGFIGSSQPQRDLRQQIWEVLVRFRGKQ